MCQSGASGVSYGNGFLFSAPLSSAVIAVFLAKAPVGWIKLNWDAATDHQNGLIGVGLVARDSRGSGAGFFVSFHALSHGSYCS
jgi:hypothetical protein